MKRNISIVKRNQRSSVGNSEDFKTLVVRNTNDITLIKDGLISLENRVSSLEDRVGSLESRITSLEDKVTSLENRVTSLEQAVIALRDEMHTNHAEILNLFQNMAQTLSDIIEENKVVTASRLTNHEGRIHSLETLAYQ